MTRLIDLSGQRFGRLTVLNDVARENGQTFWLCLCDCGKTKWIRTNVPRGGNAQSCRCLNAEIVSARSRTHGATASRAYRAWTGMKTRCLNTRNPGYKDYGGRGIKVADRWLHSFENFLADMGDPPIGKTLERILVNGDYSPDNCKWASPLEQANNKRVNAILVTDDGRFTMKQFANIHGISYGTVIRSVKKKKQKICGIPMKIEYPNQVA